ncbi:hypothetical protein C8F04DRAFT_1274926 [Mycena alexandri]|uniref:Uncharacterized protein n=1 Tax=Mycena alexandri TaxID=1745969 RepID=A0AAD6S4W3_9AGAR|nr:hypothetical protein C8F04DRAFT_1274926 [Mycena alexandri]
MQPHDLTPSELADLMAPNNHPGHLSAEELDGLTSHLSEAELDELIRRLGVPALIQQLPPVFHRVLLAAQHVNRDTSTDYDDVIDDLIADFEEADIEETSTPPPSSPEPPMMPPSARQVQSTPSTPIPPQRNPIPMQRRPPLAAAVSREPQSGVLEDPVRARIFGVFESWNDIVPRTSGHGLTIYAGYSSLQAATAALQYARAKGWTGDASPPPYDAAPPRPPILLTTRLIRAPSTNAGTPFVVVSALACIAPTWNAA